MARRTDDPTYERHAKQKSVAGQYVAQKLAFTGPYVAFMHGGYGRRWWGEWVDHGTNSARYVVYSYGRHWPLYIYMPVLRRWFVNDDTYYPNGGKRPSCGTRQHKADLHPEERCEGLTCAQMQRLVDLTKFDFVTLRVGGTLRDRLAA